MPEPLEHSVMDTGPGWSTYGGVAVLEPIEHSVPEKPLDGGR